MRFVDISLYQPARPHYDDAANLPWRVLPQIAGGGDLRGPGLHTNWTFSILCWVPFRRRKDMLAARPVQYPAEDIVSGSFVFESGVQGTGNWCFNAFEEVDRTEIVGDKGRIAYSTYDAEPIELTTVDGRSEFTVDYPVHIQQPLIQTVVDDSTGPGHCPSTGESGARTTWVMDQMLAGHTVN